MPPSGRYGPGERKEGRKEGRKEKNRNQNKHQR